MFSFHRQGLSLGRHEAPGRPWCVFWLLLFASLQPLARAADAPLLQLDPARPELAVPSALGAFGAQDRGGIEAAANGRIPLAPLSLERALRFREGDSLWLKLRVEPVRGSQESWQLEVPMPALDTVTLYQQDVAGRWFARSAGDAVPLREWPQPARHPLFQLKLREGEPTDLYLEVRNVSVRPVALRLVTAAAHAHRMQLEYLALGLVMGALSLLLLVSLLRAVLLRDGAWLWYAAYALMAVVALAAFTGVGAHLLWGNAGPWVDAAPGITAVLAGSLALGVVGRLGGGAIMRRRWLGRALQAAGIAGGVLALLYGAIERNTAMLLVCAHLLAVAVLAITASVRTWRRSDPVGIWMLLGSLPLALTVLVAAGRGLGLPQSPWFAEYGLVLALSINLPLLFAAFNSRSQERRSVELRRVASASQDALTGLLKREPFVARLHQAVARFERRGEAAAVAVIEVVNHDWIQKTRGAEAAEEALLRTVIKLRRLVRDVDTTGRLGENRFGLILEGVGMRRPMNTVAARLVASGLMDEPDAPRDCVLHFHIAAVLLPEYSAPADELLKSLTAMLEGMSPRTRRPLRFLDSSGVPVEGESRPTDAQPQAAGPSTAAA